MPEDEIVDPDKIPYEQRSHIKRSSGHSEILKILCI